MYLWGDFSTDFTMKPLKFFLSAILLAVVFSLSSCVSEGGKSARYVFYFIGDGMGFSHVALTEAYLATKEGKIGSEPLRFSSFPVMGMATTYSASNYITCSSAAGTALSTGRKTNNGMLGMAPDSTKLRSIAYDIHDAGYKVGIITTVTIDHATPGAFYANSPDRNDYYTVAAQLPESGFEFFGGGGFEGLKKMGDRKSPFEIAAENGYTVLYGESDFEANKGNAEKIIYFQSKGKENDILPYAFDRDSSDLTLAELVKGAVEVLDNEKGFFIMAEGGKIDWAAHSNDVTNTIYETLDFDQTIEVAYQFYLRHPDETLIVVTADHETGGVTLGRTKEYTFDLSIVPDRRSDAKGLETSVENYMEQIPVDSLSKAARIGWTTRSHTGGAVPVFAIGSGSDKFAGRMDNTQIPARIKEAMAL